MVLGALKGNIPAFAAVFMLGMLAASLGSGMLSEGLQMPLSLGILGGGSADVISPHDRIPDDRIKVLSDRVIIEVENASWASFTDTNSMDPFIDSEANSIEIKPRSEDDIHTGDVVSFRTSLADGVIIHRVIRTGEDEKGMYYITKGDNNPSADPGKRRFEDIEGVVVGVIY